MKTVDRRAEPCHPLALPPASPAAIDVLIEIVTRGPISRVDVARRTGLSQAAVTKAVAPLISAGFVTQEDVTPTEGAGRPAMPLSIRPDSTAFVGIKLLPGRLVAALCDFHGDIVACLARSIDSHLPDKVADEVAAVVDELSSAQANPALGGVGIAASGDVDSTTGVVRHSPRLGWRGVPLGPMVFGRLGMDVLVENDVRALTIAENWFGDGRDASSFALVTVGSGMGCGLYLNGGVVMGAHGVAGEIGHLPLAPDDLLCECGRRGCVETVASTEAIANVVRRELDLPNLDYTAVAELARAGQAEARAAFGAAGSVMGAAIATVASVVGPERIIVGGEGAFEFDLFESELRAAFQAHAFGMAADCEIVVRPQRFEQWARGAAISVLRAFVLRESAGA